MWGAVIGDIVGSIYEFDNIKTKNFKFFRNRCHFTDDSVMTIAVADCLVNNLDPVETFKYWGRRYPDSGYGGCFRQWLRSEVTRPYNSYGNGAAMRVSPAAFLAGSLEEARRLAVKVTEVTHNHPEGIKGALATVTAICMAREGKHPEEIRQRMTEEFDYDMDRSVDGIRPTYRFNATCQQTVPEAIICALDATGFEDAIRNAISIGGDSDTVACISGSIAEALFGITAEIMEEAKRFMKDELMVVMGRLYKHQ